MYTVWKTTLDPNRSVQEIDVPENAELLTARQQFESICVWYKCDPSNKITKRRIAVVGTGHPAPEGGRYVGTALLLGGSLVLHVFEAGG